jgi:hypothetical protein
MDKFSNKLLEVSNPLIVQKNADDYFDFKIKVKESNKKNKKYKIITEDGKIVHFGDINYKDYTKTQNEEKKKNYLKRAKNINGDWINDKFSANNLAINLLWR